MRDAVQDHVHECDSNHRYVEIVSIERFVPEKLPMFFLDDFIPDEIVRRAVWILFQHVGRRVLHKDMLVRGYQESPGPARRVANLLPYVGIHELNHHTNDVTGRAKLSVLS